MLSPSFSILFFPPQAVAKQCAQCNKEQLKHKHAGRQHSLSTQLTSAQRKLTLFSSLLSLSIYPHGTSNSNCMVEKKATFKAALINISTLTIDQMAVK